MKVAVIGAGIAGLAAAREIGSRGEVHVFEASTKAGGHAHTVDVEEHGQTFPIDMGFIVYNERNYPVFSKMLDELQVATVASSMGFSVSETKTGIEYSGEGWASLLADPGNALRPDFWRLLRDFVRFCRLGQEMLAQGVAGDIGSFCRVHGLSEAFQRLFLKPMAGAIWSTPRADVHDFPAQTLLRFFERHGLLSLGDRPAWRTIAGGSRSYVDRLLRGLDARIHLGEPVDWIRREELGARVSAGGSTALFDEVILALHSDQALRLLADPTPDEREVLGAIRYRPNEVVLHCDRSVLPRRRRAWASWNVVVDGPEEESIAVTYLMNKLQPLPTPTPWCVTLNPGERIDPACFRQKAILAHPQFDTQAVAAQDRWHEISGHSHTHFCGAYWRYGFHEDGAWSGQRAARALTAARSRAA